MSMLLTLMLHTGLWVTQPRVGEGPAVLPSVAVQVERTVGVLTGPRIARAQRSRELDDDLALRDDLLSYGQLMSWSRTVEVGCLARALELGTVDPERADWQVRAARRLAEIAPGHEAVTPERMAGYGENWYRAASTADKPAAGETRIESLLAAAAVAERRGEMTRGLELLRDAQRVAREINSPYAKILEDEQRRLSGLNRYQLQLDNLTRQLERRPEATAAHQAAVRFAIERHDFDTALFWAGQANDEVLVRQLTLAAGDVSRLESAEVLGLAQWFLDQAGSATLTNDYARLQAYYEARFYVHDFLNRHDKRDVLRLRALEIAQQVHEQIDSLEPEPLRRPAGSWVDLMSAVIPPRVNQPGSLMHGEHLRIRNNTLYLHESAAAIPAQVPSEYDLRFTVTRTHPNDRHEMSLYFPMSRGGGLLVLGAGGDDACRLENAAVAEDLRGFRFPEDKPVTFLLTVREWGGNQVSVRLQAEGREVIAWTGGRGQLGVDAGPPGRIGRGLVIGCGTTYEITNLAFRRAAQE